MRYLLFFRIRRDKMKKDDKVIFHNTQLLLEHYRDVVWSLDVSVFQTNVNFQAEFGNTIEEFLELSYEAGLDLPASDVAARIRSINKSRNMLRIIDSAVALLREKYRNGEECYWVLYYTYLSSQEFGGVDEIVDKYVNINHFRVLSIVFVLAAGIYIHIAQQFCAQLVLRQHTLYYFSQ